MIAALDPIVPKPRPSAVLQRCTTELRPVEPLERPAADALRGRRVVILGGSAEDRGRVHRAVLAHAGQAVDLDGGSNATARAAGADVIVDLNVTDTDRVEARVWRVALARTYDVLGAVAEDWRREPRADRCFYVAVTRLGGRLGTDPVALRQPLSGIWAGLAKTLPRELPSCNVRVVDLGDDVDPGEAVVGEICSGRFLEVGWSDGRRHVLLPRPTPIMTPLATVPDETSVVVFTGGGRGIGYHLARRLRSRWGCRVVVTGRFDEASLAAPELQLDDERFRGLCEQRLRDCRGRDEIRAARHELDRLRRARELCQNLQEARDAGEELEYHRCDVTDPADVAALFDAVDAPLAAVVHDAGIDRPARIGRKRADDAQAVVAVKVDGFLNVLDALVDRPVGVLCAVGSLTGRYGGTAGQTDYAGANDGLARLAEWAAATRPYPVTCLSWPTWDSVGLITNLDAALREMTAVPVDEGVAAWEQELVAPRAGEVLYLGTVRALSPSQLHGLPVPSDYPEAAKLVGRRHLLGEVTSWVPGKQLGTRHHFDVRRLPAADGFLVGGAPSLPVSLVVELLLDAAAWLREPGTPAPPACLRGLRVELRPLRLPARGTLTLSREARVRDATAGRLVEVLICDPSEPSGSAVASATVCDAAPAARGGAGLEAAVATEPTLDELVARAPSALPRAWGEVAWCASEYVMSAATAGGKCIVEAEAPRGTDLYAEVHSPEPTYPVGALEGIWWASCPDTAAADWSLSVDELRACDGDVRRCRTAHVDAASGTAVARDDAGRAVVAVKGIRWRAGGAAS